MFVVQDTPVEHTGHSQGSRFTQISDSGPSQGSWYKLQTPFRCLLNTSPSLSAPSCAPASELAPG